MGVWIETLRRPGSPGAKIVTPCMGVWIETWVVGDESRRWARHTLYGCVD